MTKRSLLHIGLLACIVLLGTSVSSDPVWAQRKQPAEGTLQQRKDCADDARMVCGRFIPDVARITECMTANKRQLSPQCRRHFR
ncbi:MAG: hypothetical protein ACOY5F_11670 [Pseudomonadota bacterium]